MAEEVVQSKLEAAAAKLAAETAAKHSQQQVDQLQAALKQQTIALAAVKPSLGVVQGIACIIRCWNSLCCTFYCISRHCILIALYSQSRYRGTCGIVAIPSAYYLSLNNYTIDLCMIVHASTMHCMC